jgi:hypothetical protein
VLVLVYPYVCSNVLAVVILYRSLYEAYSSCASALNASHRSPRTQVITQGTSSVCALEGSTEAAQFH